MSLNKKSYTRTDGKPAQFEFNKPEPNKGDVIRVELHVASGEAVIIREGMPKEVLKQPYKFSPGLPQYGDGAALIFLVLALQDANRRIKTLEDRLEKHQD